MPYDRRSAEFNESTYATHVTNEITQFLRQQGDLTGVPITPTLKDEADLGYDLAISAQWGMIYLQYKVAEYIRGRNAREYSRLNHSYFRFAVKSDMTSNFRIQHNTLCELEEQEITRGGLVYYFAPAFLTMNEFLEHLLVQVVMDHSVYASPLHLGRVQRDAVHHYTYTCQTDVVPFSEPGPERSGDFRLSLSNIREIVLNVDQLSLADYLDETARMLQSVSSLDVAPTLPAIQRIMAVTSALNLQPFLVRYETPSLSIDG